VAYMSPEQARGVAVDARTDVWSLGVLLYEMLSGQRPFSGASSTDVLAAILDHDPSPLTRFDPDTPSELTRIVGKAMRKDPDQRYQVMKDLLLDLQALRDQLGASSGAQTAAPASANRTRRARAMASVAVVGAVVIAIGIWSLMRRPSSAPPSAQVTVDRPLTRLTFDPGLQTDATFSPDGRSIAYASDRAGNFDIWVQSLDGSAARQLTKSTAQETEPAWSPDGKVIVYRSERDGGGLFVVPAQGGAERQLTSFGRYPWWSANGSEIHFRTLVGESQTAGIFAVSADGGESPRELLQDFLRGGVWSWIAPHPDGRISAIGLHARSGYGFYTVSRDGRQVVSSVVAKDVPLQWTEGQTRPLRFGWNADGTALYLEAILNEVRNVWRVRVDPAALTWVSAQRLTTGSGPDAAAALSPDGRRIAFTVQRRSTRLWVFPFDSRSGRVTGKGSALTPEEGGVEGATLSPDGRFVAYGIRRAGSRDVEARVTDIDANTTEVLGVTGSAAWSPDSKTLAYALARPDRPPPGEWALALRQVGGPERIIRRWSSESVLLPWSWTCDGRAILGSYVSPLYTVAKLALWPVAPTPADHVGRILLADPHRMLWQGHLSPDCRWLSFEVQMVDDPSQVEINVAPASGAPQANWVRIAADHPWADKARWAPDGKALYFISNQGSSFFNLWGVRFDPDRGKPIGAPFVITTFDSPGLVISPDLGSSEIGISARRAVLTMATVTGGIWMLENVDQ